MKSEQRKNNGFKPGMSGNPNGRPPKGYSITEAFKSMLSAEPEVKAQIVQSIKDKALKGDTTAQKMIWEYMDGKAKQPIVGGDDEDSPMQMTVTIKKL